MFAPATVGGGFLPEEGKYTVECVRIEEAPDNGYGPGIRWVLALYKNGQRVALGDQADGEFWQTTGMSMGPAARARQYAEAFLGRQLETGERVNPNDLLGKRLMGMVIHEASKSDATRMVAKLVSVKPLANGATSKASAAQVSADPSSEEIDRALLVTTVEKLIAKAEKLGTPNHLDWLSRDLSKLSVRDLETLRAGVQAEIDA